MSKESSMVGTIGVIGSAIGIAAGAASLVKILSISTLGAGAYIAEASLWILWFIIQGIAFLAVFRERNDNAALAAFIFAIVSALFEAVVMVILLSAPSLEEIAVGLTTLLQLFFAILIGTVCEAAYLVFCGIAVLHMIRYGVSESIANISGLVLIVAGCVVGMSLFGATSIVVSIVVIAANTLACLLFNSFRSSRYQASLPEESGSGIELK
jgi:hypothetical protein